MSNVREMAVRKSLKPLKYEHIIYSLEAVDLEISEYVITLAKFFNVAIS